MLIPAAVALFVAWSLLIPAAQLDRTSRFRALGRSRRLVRHQALTVTALVLFTAVLGNVVGGVLATSVTLAVQAPFTVVNLVPGETAGPSNSRSRRQCPPDDLGVEAAASRDQRTPVSRGR